MNYKGIEIETHNAGSAEATADAPDGQQFKTTGTTQVVCSLYGGGRANLALCVASVKRDIDEGFEPYTPEAEE